MVDGFLEETEDLARIAGEQARQASTSPGALLAHLYATHGIQALAQVSGHFAAVIVDIASDHVYLVADRLGTKPLFYAETANGWGWASAIKALVPLLDRRTVNADALAEAFHFRYLVGESTLLQQVRQVLPSHWVRLQAEHSPEAHRYFHFTFQPEENNDDRSRLVSLVDDALDEYFSNLRRRHNNIGILLSGGVDSSLLAAKACRHGFDRILAVTVRWPGHANPEAERSARVAKHLKLEYRVVDVPDEFVHHHLPQLVWHTEEPPRHYSSFALEKMFAETSGEIDAFVSGEGADNLYGPDELVWIRTYAARQRLLRPVPRGVLRMLGNVLPSKGANRLRRLGDVFRYTTADYFARLDSIPSDPKASELVAGLPDEPQHSEAIRNTFGSRNPRYEEQFQDLHLYTVNRSHTVAYDRSGEPCNIVVEMPFLLSRLSGIGKALPVSMKLDRNTAKPIVKELACRHFPKEWIYEPKYGFPAPLADWMTGPLAPWLSLLQEERTRARGLYRPEVLSRLQAGRDAQLLWTALTLELCLRQLIDGDEPPSVDRR
jgi:asparagine synthase (glutamine-hydrolysing)